MRKSIRELVADLIGSLGPTAVQAMTGTKDRSMPAAWAREDGPRPRNNTEAQLRLGYRVLTMVRAAEVVGAAEAFADDTHG